MRAIICGGREFNNGRFVTFKLDEIDAERRIDVVIEGGQRQWCKGRIIGGADWHANQWAEKRGREIITVPARWDDFSDPRSFTRLRMRSQKPYNPVAGTIRNEEMLELKPDIVIGFPGGPGTADMLKMADRAGIEIIKILD